MQSGSSADKSVKCHLRIKMFGAVQRLAMRKNLQDSHTSANHVLVGWLHMQTSGQTLQSDVAEYLESQ